MYLFLLLICVTSFNNIEGKAIELTNDNFVSLRGEVNDLSINNLINNLINLKSDTRYIYINTNGGSVDAGLNLINTIKNLESDNIVVNCIAETAISMGFVIFQGCKGRYVLEHSTLMQHQISLHGMGGEIKNINSYLKFVNNMENKLNKIQAKRIGIELKDFEDKIHDDWWMDSEEAIRNNVADQIVTIKCNFVNVEEEVEIVTMFGKINTVYMKCPQVSGIIKIKENNNININKDININDLFKSNRFYDRFF